MKKVLYIFAAVALLLGVASCQKDKDEDPEENITTQQAGVYNPGMKISRIYYQYGDGEKELEEIWYWENNKLIKIRNGHGEEIHTYTYQNNRLCERVSQDVLRISNVVFSIGVSSYVYHYEGANLSTIEATMTIGDFNYEFNYNSGKISSIYLFDGQSMGVFDFTWDGGNISSFQFNNTTYTFIYDNKNNPYCGSSEFLANWGYMDNESVTKTMSKNNLTKHYVDGKLHDEYSYEYNSKGYPVKKIQTVHDSDGTIAATHTYYYEYLED